VSRTSEVDHRHPQDTRSYRLHIPAFCMSPSADGRGGLTSGTPKQPGLEHSSASIAHPLSNRFPISAEAASDCCLRRIDSSVSTGGAKTGELRVLETSVGGVEERKLWLPAEASSLGVDGRAFGPAIPSVIEGGTEVEGLD